MFPAPSQSPRVTLLENLSKLSAKDQEFARDIMSKPETPGRLLWIGKLAERATRAPAKPATVGDIAPIVAMISLAKSQLKWPAILLGDPASPLRVTIAGAAAREPGSLTLTSATERTEDGRRAWFGRVTLAGEFQPSRDLPAVEAEAIHALLVSFARDPQGEARRFARRSGRCCFCNLRLEDRDQVSTVLGWGPVCARKWGLPHSKSAAAAVLACEPADVREDFAMEQAERDHEAACEGREAVRNEWRAHGRAPALRGWPDGSQDDMGVI